MTIYLDEDTVVAINTELCGGDGHLDNPDRLRATLHRPQSGSGDTDFFPTVWAKAGAYMHGIASSHAFRDGNKRTAWVVTRLFLQLNGQDLRWMPDSTRELCVLAIATNAQGPGDEGVPLAAEWLKANSASLMTWDPGTSSDPAPAQFVTDFGLGFGALPTLGIESAGYTDQVWFQIMFEVLASGTTPDDLREWEGPLPVTRQMLLLRPHEAGPLSFLIGAQGMSYADTWRDVPGGFMFATWCMEQAAARTHGIPADYVDPS